MGTIVVTGSAGGMGRAVRAVLNSEGHTVIGVDVADAEVEADLSTPGGRKAMVRFAAAGSTGWWWRPASRRATREPSFR